jgi:seryl-tRNA(Sec) selenium transferase
MTLSRRSLMQAGTAATLAAPAAVPGASVPGIYQRLGVRPIINAVGTLTTLSGTLMLPEVKRAMDEASGCFVRIHELQEKAGKRLAELTGAHAAFVTGGFSLALPGNVRGNGRC